MNRPMVSMDQRKEQNIRRLLSDLKDEEGEEARGGEPWGSSGAAGGAGPPKPKWQPEALPKPAWGASANPQIKEEPRAVKRELPTGPPPDHWDDDLSDEDMANMEEPSQDGDACQW